MASRNISVSEVSRPILPRHAKLKFDEVRQRMVQFIKTHYSQTLGKDIELLDQPGGLEKLHKKYCL